MPVSRTTGSQSTQGTQRGTSNQKQRGTSESIQSGFSELLVDAPGALENALQQLVMGFMGQVAGGQAPVGPSPEDAALVEQIRSQTFGQALGDINRAYSDQADSITTRLARFGLRDSSAMTDSMARLERDRQANIARVGTQGATQAAGQLLSLTESARNRWLQSRGLALSGAGTAIQGVTALGNLRAALGRRIYENRNLGSSEQSAYGSTFGESSTRTNSYQETRTPFDVVGLAGGLGNIVGAL